MPSWYQINKQVESLPPKDQGEWLQTQINKTIALLQQITGRNVIIYASSFLQKPTLQGVFLSINQDDINGFMSGVYSLDCDKGLLLLLHTPGGIPDAAETIVDYLWSKFPYIETLIPTYAMSAGTMIALASNALIMGRQSQLGPTDPQLLIDGRLTSAHSLVAQFEEAKKEIADDMKIAHAWAPLLQRFTPGLLPEARKALAYTNDIVSNRLQNRMFKGQTDAVTHAQAVADFFGGKTHGSHGAHRPVPPPLPRPGRYPGSPR
jgi:ClpP class serine protease